MSYIFRAFTPSDAPALHTALYADMPLAELHMQLHLTWHLMQTGRGLGVVVWEDGRAIGFGQYTQWGKVCEMSDLQILPTHRRQGIGTGLIRHLAYRANEAGMIVAEIGVDAHNDLARRLYERLGFAYHRQVDIETQPIHYLRCALKRLLNP